MVHLFLLDATVKEVEAELLTAAELHVTLLQSDIAQLIDSVSWPSPDASDIAKALRLGGGEAIISSKAASGAGGAGTAATVSGAGGAGTAATVIGAGGPYSTMLC